MLQAKKLKNYAQEWLQQAVDLAPYSLSQAFMVNFGMAVCYTLWDEHSQISSSQLCSCISG